MIQLIQGDCLEVLEHLNQKVDLVLTDPPYGTTKCKWDVLLPLDKMWDVLEGVTSENTPIVLFGAEPFASLLRSSNLKMYKYDWYWNKKHGANFAQANKRPLNVIETISVFYKKPPIYNAQKEPNPKGEEKRQKYAPSKQKEVFVGQVAMANEFTQAGSQYESDKLLPRSLITFSREHKPIHPTQKPIPLLEYLIKTYTNDGDTVLDFTMGSGSTCIAAEALGRNSIGIEKDEQIFAQAKLRINNYLVSVGKERL